MKNLDDFVEKILAWSNLLKSQYADYKIELTDEHINIAKQVGVSAPNQIQVFTLNNIPTETLPEAKVLRDMLGLKGCRTLGLTLGYDVYLTKDKICPALLAHEFRHVYQFEQTACLATFLKQYLLEVMEYGYESAPMEQDALAFQLLFENQSPNQY